MANDTEAGGKTIRILVLGDSISAGYGLDDPQMTLPAVLERALNTDDAIAQNAISAVRLINAGVSGDTTGGGLARLDWSLADTPDIVMVELGGNDSLRGIDPAITHRNLDAIIENILARDMAVILTGMRGSPSYGTEYRQAFDALFVALKEKYEQRQDFYFYPFILEGVAGNPALNQADGIHPNEAGVRIIADNLIGLMRAVVLEQAGQ